MNNQRKKYTEQDKTIIVNDVNVYGIEAVAERLGRKPEAVYKKAWRMGLMPTRKRKPEFQFQPLATELEPMYGPIEKNPYQHCATDDTLNDVLERHDKRRAEQEHYFWVFFRRAVIVMVLFGLGYAVAKLGGV